MNLGRECGESGWGFVLTLAIRVALQSLNPLHIAVAIVVIDHTIIIPYPYRNLIAELYQNHVGGGNVNKLLSMSAGKLTNIEFRAMKDRGAPEEAGRTVTSYLIECASAPVEYLVEGVRREAESWVQTRKQRHDLAESEFEASWDNIRRRAFECAYEWCQQLLIKAQQLGHHEDAQVAIEMEQKFREVFNQAAEIGQLGNY